LRSSTSSAAVIRSEPRPAGSRTLILGVFIRGSLVCRSVERSARMSRAMRSSRSRRNPYRPGTASYARFRKADLKRKLVLAQATAARAKTSETVRHAKQRATTAQRALRAIETREEFRSRLNGSDRADFGQMPIAQQERLIKIQREYPETVPQDLPDPFVGPQRNVLWRLSYSTRAGIRLRASA
jgi:hypothetical protein